MAKELTEKEDTLIFNVNINLMITYTGIQIELNYFINKKNVQ